MRKVYIPAGDQCCFIPYMHVYIYMHACMQLQGISLCSYTMYLLSAIIVACVLRTVYVVTLHVYRVENRL